MHGRRVVAVSRHHHARRHTPARRFPCARERGRYVGSYRTHPSRRRQEDSAVLMRCCDLTAFDGSPRGAHHGARTYPEFTLERSMRPASRAVMSAVMSTVMSTVMSAQSAFASRARRVCVSVRGSRTRLLSTSRPLSAAGRRPHRSRRAWLARRCAIPQCCPHSLPRA